MRQGGLRTDNTEMISWHAGKPSQADAKSARSRWCTPVVKGLSVFDSEADLLNEKWDAHASKIIVKCAPSMRAGAKLFATETMTAVASEVALRRAWAPGSA